MKKATLEKAVKLNDEIEELTDKIFAVDQWIAGLESSNIQVDFNTSYVKREGRTPHNVTVYLDKEEELLLLRMMNVKLAKQLDEKKTEFSLLEDHDHE